MKFPDSLKEGDNIFLLSLSSPINEEDIEKCCNVIKEMGYNPIVGKSLYENYGGYMAGKSEIRLNDLHKAFSDKEIKGIFCVRGGFSSSQLLEKIDYKLIKKNPKVFIGYSDVTNLHIVFNQKCKMGTFHGPMVKSNMIDDFNDYTKKSFFKAINEKSWKYEEPISKSVKILKKGKATGVLSGGNLCLITTTLGTEYEIDTKDKILFLEEISEEISRIDRMMTHLKYAGKFNDCKGVILGNFKNCINSDDEKYDLMTFMKEFFEDYDKPVFYGIESGHDKPFMATLPLGAKCTIDDEKIEIFFEK